MRTIGLSFLSLLTVGGCSSSTPTNNGDMSVPGDMAAAVGDMVTPAADMTTTVITGTKLIGTSVALVGVTSDGYVAYLDNATFAVVVVDLKGKNPAILGGNALGQVWGKSVLSWHDGPNPNDYNGPLAVWTAANGAHELSVNSFAGNSAASPDGAYVAYFDNFATPTADLKVARTDGSNVKTLVAGVLVGTPCQPQIDFVGSRLVASYCPPPGDAAVSPVTVTSFDPATGTGVDLATNAIDFWVADKAGTRVLVKSMANVGTVVPVAGVASDGGIQMPITIANLGDAEFTPDGAAILYTTTDTFSLVRITVPGGVKTVLQPAGAPNLDGISPDGMFALFHSKTDMMSGFTNLLLGSATAATAPVTLSATATAASGGTFGAQFTADSSRALFFSAVDPATSVGSLNAQPVAAMTAKLLGDKVFVVYAAAGAKVVYNDNWRAFSMTSGRADLEALDLAQGAPTLIASSANADVFLTPDGKSVLYTTDADPKRQGLYLAPLP